MKTLRDPRRRTLLGLALCALLLAGACAEEAPVPPGTIVVDDDHDYGMDDKAEPYVVEARSSLRLETRGHEVRARGRPAESIRVLGPGEYRTDWDGIAPIELGPDTLTPIKPTDPPFPGFVAGKRYIIGAGVESPGTGRTGFEMMWAGRVDVRAAKP